MKIELLLAEYTGADPTKAPSALSELATIQKELSNLDRAGPGFPSRLYRKAEAEHLSGWSDGGLLATLLRRLWPFSRAGSEAARTRSEGPAGP